MRKIFPYGGCVVLFWRSGVVKKRRDPSPGVAKPKNCATAEDDGQARREEGHASITSQGSEGFYEDRPPRRVVRANSGEMSEEGRRHRQATRRKAVHHPGNEREEEARSRPVKAKYEAH